VRGLDPGAPFAEALLAAQRHWGEGVIVVDQALRIRWASEPVRTLLGYDEAELAALLLPSLVLPSDRRLIEERARLRFRGEDVPPRYQVDLLRKSGKVVRVETTVVRFDSDGEPLLLGIIRDLSEVSRLAEERRPSDPDFSATNFRRLAEASVDVIGLSGVQGKWRFVSPACRQVLGYEPEELVGHTDGWDLMHPDDQAEVLRLYQVGLSSGRATIPVSFRMKRKDGSWVWVESLAKLILDEKGAVSEIYFAMRDISERRAAEAALRRSEARFRSLIEGLPDGIVVHHGGVIAYANAALCALLGYGSGDQLVGRELSELLQPEERTRGGALTGDAPSSSGPSEMTLLRRDRGQVTVESVRIALEFDGRPATLLSIRDVTERRAIQSRLVQADRMISIGTLAAGVAHEINNPLVAVIANLDHAAEVLPALTDGPDASGKVLADLRATVEDGRTGADRVRKIVADLKIFARGNDDQRGAIDLRPTLDSAIGLAWNEIRHRARLAKDYRAVPPVAANEARLGQVFVNLLINAAQAIPEGQADRNEIVIATYTDGLGRAVVEVRDTGQGITPSVRARIFDPFFTTKAIGVGTGLGLSICHGIVSALGGEITVESAPGRGSTFRVSLPTTIEALPERALAPPPLVAPARRGRLLIVDDDPIVASVIARTLADAHEVVAVVSGAEALRELEGDPFDLVLCDLMMPVMTGMDLYNHVVASDPDLARKMVFITGGAFTERARDFLGTVENARLEKPFDARTLRTLVNERLR
jgi:PAS domain S-box-containing protein